MDNARPNPVLLVQLDLQSLVPTFQHKLCVRCRKKRPEVSEPIQMKLTLASELVRVFEDSAKDSLRYLQYLGIILPQARPRQLSDLQVPAWCNRSLTRLDDSRTCTSGGGS